MRVWTIARFTNENPNSVIFWSGDNTWATDRLFAIQFVRRRDADFVARTLPAPSGLPTMVEV